MIMYAIVSADDEESILSIWPDLELAEDELNTFDIGDRHSDCYEVLIKEVELEIK